MWQYGKNLATVTYCKKAIQTLTASGKKKITCNVDVTKKKKKDMRVMNCLLGNPCKVCELREMNSVIHNYIRSNRCNGDSSKEWLMGKSSV